MLPSVGDRLMQTLSIRHVAFFLAEEGAAPGESGRSHRVFRLTKAMGNNPRLASVELRRPGPEFSQLEPAEPYLFFERTRHQLDAISQRLAGHRCATPSPTWT